MNLKLEYSVEQIVNGKPAVLNFVDSEIDPATGDTIIRRRYINNDLETETKTVRILKAAKIPIVVVSESESEEIVSDRYTGPVEITDHKKYDDSVKTAKGMMVVFEHQDRYYKGRVAKIMPRTVAIDVPGGKDVAIKNKMVLGQFSGKTE